jgi:signal transduction histidine kinase
MLSRLTRSVRGKLMLVVLATTLLALSLSSAALVVYDLITYERSRAGDLVSLASIIARAGAPALAFRDERAAAGNLALLRAGPNISAAALYDAQGRSFAAYNLPEEGAEALPTAIALPQEDGYRIEGRQVLVFQRIVENNELLGAIYIRGLYEPLVRLNDYVTILITVMLASMAVAALISIWLQQRITEPIFAVTDVARQVMEKRDFSLRVKKSTHDEIGILVDAFNDMLAEVGRRAQALQDSNANLEHEMAERREAEAALRDADRRKDEFLATLAHELRNPLAPLRNSLEILRRVPGDSPTGAKAREMMDRQLKQMVRLVDDLLDVSRITTGKLAVRTQDVELQAVIADALETVRPVLEAGRHSLVVELPAEPLRLQGDATRLAQVFANLLNNAAKYTDPGGRITLRGEAQGREAVVSVIDTGIGISAEMLPLVFRMFTQADHSLERAQAGLGVGLTLARRLVELHGGTIEGQSEGLGRGSRFVVRLPLDTGQAPSAEA